MTDVCLYERAGGIATITLNRPEALNALDESLSDGLIKALGDAGSDLGVRCVILTGAGRAFCSGADLQEAKKRIAEHGTMQPSEILRDRYNPIVRQIVEMEKPVIAAMNGIAAGAGASLALACDLRIASDKAGFMQAFVKIGLVPDAGANYFLPHLVGYQKALELALTGDVVGAEEAQRIGLVNRVVPHDDLMAQAHAFAEPFATGPTRAYALTKKAMRFGAVHDLTSVMDYEPDLQDQAALTADAREGIAAFVEKRAPRYDGR
ncbi:MAG TPA: enoyl-CoA hydratase-related protein [Actinomycetota bacterium]